ncbi:hypothetical protein ACFQ1I_01810 [Kitasatospora arboriphila]
MSRSPQSGVAALPRSLGVFGGVLLTLSCVTPASSLFIVVPPLLQTQGSGTVLTLLIAALLSLGVGFCYAELGTLVPSAAASTRSSGSCSAGWPAGWCS